MYAYPLHWPRGRKKTGGHKLDPQVLVGFVQARNNFLGQLARLRATNIVISTNIPYHYGRPQSDRADGRRSKAVAVWFQMRDAGQQARQYCLTCDLWESVTANLLELFALLSRWEHLHRFDRSSFWEALGEWWVSEPSPPGDFERDTGPAPDPWRSSTESQRSGPHHSSPGAGFHYQWVPPTNERPPAPPPPRATQAWWQVLGLSSPSVPLNQAQSAYRKMVHKHHPDIGGDAEMMKQINEAMEHARRLCL